MPTTLIYRPEDLSFDTFHALDRECFPKEPVKQDMFDGFISNDFWAAYNDDTLVGFSYLRVNPELAWIARIGVAAAARGRGIGTRLMGAMIDHCRTIPRRPTFPTQWSDLADRHDPPRAYVFVFAEADNEPVGYCRLIPDFPGCFPLELISPEKYLRASLMALKPYLSENHQTVKLTIGDSEIARACDALGARLNYRLYKMILELS